MCGCMDGALSGMSHTALVTRCLYKEERVLRTWN